MHTHDYWRQAIKELSKRDAVMKRIIASYEGDLMQGRGDAFHTLMRSITGQQISVKAADAVWGRLEGQVSGIGSQVSVKGTPQLRPETCNLIPDEALRACGYSRQKITYIRSLCEFFITRKHLERDWAEMDDEAVIKDITQIKGIGRWTAEMFLMFHLMRPNVLPLDDLGLVNAIAKFYCHGQKPDKAKMRKVAENWQPWCSVATWYLWRTYDADPVSY